MALCTNYQYTKIILQLYYTKKQLLHAKTPQSGKLLEGSNCATQIGPINIYKVDSGDNCFQSLGSSRGQERTPIPIQIGDPLRLGLVLIQRPSIIVTKRETPSVHCQITQTDEQEVDGGRGWLKPEETAGFITQWKIRNWLSLLKGDDASIWGWRRGNGAGGLVLNPSGQTSVSTLQMRVKCTGARAALQTRRNEDIIARSPSASPLTRPGMRGEIFHHLLTPETQSGCDYWGI